MRHYPRVEHLRRKQCWICLGEETDGREKEAAEDVPASNEVLSGSAQNSSTSPSASPSASSSRWLHPCQCALIAHEDCLMRWIDTSPNARHPKCPMCAASFQIKRPNSILPSIYPLLSHIEYTVDRSAAPVTLIGLAYCLSNLLTQYGKWACRLYFIGQANDADGLLRRLEWEEEWSMRPRWRDALEMPLIPLALVFGGVPVFAPIRPIFMPIWLVGEVIQKSVVSPSWTMNLATWTLRQDFTWPPSPRMALYFLTSIQVVYRQLHHQVRCWILEYAGLPRQQLPRIYNFSDYWLAFDDLMHDDEGNAVPTTAVGLPRVTIAIEEQAGGQQQQQQAATQVEQREPGSFSIRARAGTIVQSVLGSLLMPQIAYTTGQMLVWLAKGRSKWLEKLLGLQILQPHGVLNKLGLSGGNSTRTCVWWHTILGGLIYVVVRDTLKLWYEVSEIRWRAQRTIVDKPFDKINLDELDLVPNWQVIR